MAMPRITSRNTVTTPSSLEKEYGDFEIALFRVRGLPGNDKSVKCVLRPYNWETKEFASGVEGLTLDIPSLNDEMDRCSVVQDVVNELGGLLNKLVIEKQLVAEIAALEEGEDPTGLQNQLNSVRSQLGVS